MSKKQSKASNNICRFKADLLPEYKRSNNFEQLHFVFRPIIGIFE
jgi:hypothetical protein